MTAIGPIAALILPALAAMLWLRWGDRIKSRHPLSRKTQVSTLPTQRRWNFGIAKDRKDWNQWRVLLGHAEPITGIPVSVIVGWTLGTLAGGMPWSTEAAVCIALYLSGPLLNWRVSVEHSYYQCATGIFLIGAVGFSIIGIESLWVFVPIALGIWHWHRTYKQLQRQPVDPAFLAAVEQVRTQCPEDCIVVTLGLDWNPTLLFHAERRGLMIPNWPEIYRVDVQSALSNLKRYRYRIGMVLLMGDGPNGITREWVAQELQSQGMMP